MKPTQEQYQRLYCLINYDEGTIPTIKNDDFHFSFKGKEYFIDRCGQWHLCEPLTYGSSSVLLVIGMNFDDVVPKVNKYLEGLKNVSN